MRGIKEYILIVFKGMAMGAADVVPGVSGGTIAFISGIYEEFINSLKGLNISNVKRLFTHGFKDFWKAINGSFLVALFLGIAISVLSLSKVIKGLLESDPILVWSFFFGLVLASIVFIGKQITKWNAPAIIAMLIGAIISYAITVLNPASGSESYLFLFLAGFFAIVAMILPGISGAFILLLMGAYQTVMEIITNITSFNKDLMIDSFTKLTVFGTGAIIGLLSFSRVLSYMFANHKNTTLALLTGFMIGSLNKIWPWKEVLSTRINSHGIEVPFITKNISPMLMNTNNFLGFALGLIALGFITILILEKIGESNTKTQ